ncbi:MAG: fumarylacetoacetate hydrolase family protein [Anaerolineales bacterium]|nr:MAG: fumarylacetoacetate hydrolase family protein [Anaerolineales bacterium]
MLGYTVGNELTARDLQQTDGQWTRAKGFDTFCPFRPLDRHRLRPGGRADHLPRQRAMRQLASTRDMVFGVGVLVAYVSSVMTLEPGDLIFTGTPAGVSPLQPGDTVEAEIEGLGLLSNPVRSAD